MKRLILTSILAIGCLASADVGVKVSRSQLNSSRIIKVAVIDTGLSKELFDDNSICKTGHKDFTGSGLEDRHGHGTHISGIIDQYAKNFFLVENGNGIDLKKIKVDYCQIIIKYLDPKATNQDTLNNTINSLRWAIDQKVDIINYSGGGIDFSKEERNLIVEALDKGIKVVAAAGNNRSNIDKYKYYPAMYDKRIFIVGNLVKNLVNRKPTSNINSDIAPSSNWGESINTWELGTNVLSRLPNKSFGYLTGTSQATAVKSGKLVREMMLKLNH